MIKPFVILIYLGLIFFFFYFIWKKRYLYSLIITVVFLALFSFGAYLGATAKNTTCTTPHKAFSELPLKLETAEDYYMKGNFLYDQGECDDAITNYTKAIELDPTISQFYNNRGYSYMMKEDYKNALSDFDKAIQIRPSYARALLNRGDIYARHEINKEKAISNYKTIITQGPYSIKDTSVCGRLLMIKYNWLTPQWILEFIELAKTNGQGCGK